MNILAIVAACAVGCAVTILTGAEFPANIAIGVACGVIVPLLVLRLAR